MRQNWEPTQQDLSLGLPEIAALLAPAFPAATVTAARRQHGGLANATYVATLDGHETEVGVRVYLRDADSAPIEQAVMQLALRHGLPVPEILYAARKNPVTPHPYVLVDWLPGETLQSALTTHADDPAEAVALGEAVGGLLAELDAIRFPHAGFFKPSLAIATPLRLDGEAVSSLLRSWCREPLPASRLDAGLAAALDDCLAQHASILDEVEDLEPALTHGDFDATNILVQRTDDGWRISGLLDWEFAFAGSPLVDLGHALRPPGGSAPGFTAGLERGFRLHGGRLPADWRRQAQLLDLLSWLQFLQRPAAGARLVLDANTMIRTIISRVVPAPRR